MDTPDPIPAIAEPTVVFVINRAWSSGADAAATYDATRKYWRVGAKTRERAVCALGVAGGVVRGAYRIQSWHPGGGDGRWGFDGVPAPELCVVGTSVERLAPPRGAANPVRLYLDGIPPADEKPVQAIARELNMEPLARIMYGQRELFHSNLLAWLFDTLPELADAVFRDLTEDAPSETSERGVERERESLDLVLRWPGAAPLVIENKVFSLPDKAQLDRYRAKTARWKGAPPRHVLLSMSPPHEPAEGWTYLSYQELAERIDLALAASSRDKTYEVETVRHYSRVVRLLNALLDTTVIRSTDEQVWLDSSQLAAIDSSQTRTALRKLRARRVQAMLAADGPGTGWTESAISHSHPLVGWRRHVRVAGVRIEAGWQYQEGQFRRCVVLPHLAGRSEKNKRARNAFAAAHPELFDLTPLHEVLAPADHQPRPLDRYGHFAPSFVYRYVKAPDQAVAQLIQATHAINAALEELSR